MKLPGELPQVEMDYSPRDRGTRAWETVLAVVRLAVDRMTLKEVAFLLDTSPSFLADALAERDRKGVKAEWLIVLIIGAPPKVRAELVFEINRVAGFKAPELAKPLTDAQKLAIVLRAVKRLAPGIVSSIDEEVDAST